MGRLAALGVQQSDRGPALARGEVWRARLPQGQAFHVLVISDNRIANGQSAVVHTLTLTTTYLGLASHIELNPAEAELPAGTYVRCDDVLTVARENFDVRLGML